MTTDRVPSETLAEMREQFKRQSRWTPNEIANAVAALDELLARRAQDAQEPVAWRCRDYAGEWIICQTEEGMLRYKLAVGGLIQPLYASPPQAEQGYKMVPVGWFQGGDGVYEQVSTLYCDEPDVFQLYQRQ